MTIINKYFDIFINNGNRSFYFIDSPSKPKNHGSAKSTLAKIEFIVKHNLPYDLDHQDIYSKKSERELLTFLEEKSLQICHAYYAKQAKINRVMRKILAGKKRFKLNT